MWGTEPAVTFSAPAFRVEVITLILYQAGESGSYFLVEPPYQSALADIKRFYPQLSFSQNVITDPTWIQCGDLMPVSDDTLAKFYYSNERKWREANLTVFITNESDCDGHASAYLATALRKLFMSTSFAFDIDNKNKWPTRLETGAGGKSANAWSTKLFTGFFRHFNWTTIAIVCEAKRNPMVLLSCQTLHRGVSSALRSNITILRVDGFSSETNFTFVMEELNRQTRVILYDVFGGTLRKCMLAAHALNMTQGNHVYLAYIMQRHPVFGNYNPKYGDEQDEAAKLAYATVIFIEKDMADDFPVPGTDRYCLREGWRNSSATKFNTTYASDTVNLHLTAAYAMLMITAKVVNEFLESNQSDLLTDGANIVQKMYNRSFNLRTGKFGFNQFGSVMGSNYLAQQFDHRGKLSITHKIQVEPIQITEVNPVRWPEPVWPVPNRPRCGYDGQDPVCWLSGSSSTGVAAGAGAAVGAVLLIAGLLGLVLKRKLAGQVWWMVLEEDIRYGRLDSKARQVKQSYMEFDIKLWRTTSSSDRKDRRYQKQNLVKCE